MKGLLHLSLWAILLSTFASVAVADDPQAQMTLIKKNIREKKAVFLDVREDKETRNGFIRGSALVPLSLLEQGGKMKDFDKVLAQMLPKDRDILCISQGDPRSFQAAKLLKQLGFRAYGLKFSYVDLARAGFPAMTPRIANQRQSPDSGASR